MKFFALLVLAAAAAHAQTTSRVYAAPELRLWLAVYLGTSVNL